MSYLIRWPGAGWRVIYFRILLNTISNTRWCWSYGGLKLVQCPLLETRWDAASLRWDVGELEYLKPSSIIVIPLSSSASSSSSSSCRAVWRPSKCSLHQETLVDLTSGIFNSDYLKRSVHSVMFSCWELFDECWRNEILLQALNFALVGAQQFSSEIE